MAETLIYKVSIDAGASLKSISDLVARNKELKKTLEEAGASSKENFAELATEFSKNTKAINDFRAGLRNFAQTANQSITPLRDSYAGLREEQSKLLKQLRTMSPKDTGFPALLQQVKQNQLQLDNFNRSINSSGNIVADYGSGIRKAFAGIGQSILAGLAIGGITGFVSEVSRLQAELSDLQANVRKTVGFNERQVQQFTTQLQSIDTRTSLKGLFEISAIGGQLGLGAKDILTFTEAVDKAVVALGDEFTGGAEEVTKVVGGLRNVLVDFKTQDTGKDILNLSNALNALGASGSATAPVVSDFASRIGGVGIPLGLTSGQVLGLSATLQELNVTAERGGSGVIRILQKMASEPQKFAQVAGVSVQEFTNLVNTDLFGAFQKVAQGANKSSAQATVFADVLKELDVDGIGASEVLGKLGGNLDLLRKRTDLATTSLKQTGSITQEFAIKNETYAAQLEKAYKNFGNALISIGNVFGKVFGTLFIQFDKFLGLSNSLPEKTAPAIQAIRAEKDNLNSLVLAIKDTNTSNEARKVLIKELNESYPEFTKKIDISKASDAELKKVLDETNRAYEQRIFVLSKQEVIQDIEKKRLASIAREAQAEKELQDIRQGFYIDQLTGQKTTNQRTLSLAKVGREAIIREEQALRKGLVKEKEDRLKAVQKIAEKEGLSEIETRARQNNDAIKSLKDRYAKERKAREDRKKAIQTQDKQATDKEVKQAQKTAKELLDIEINNIKEREALRLAEAEKSFLLSEKTIDDEIVFEVEKQKIKTDSFDAQIKALKNANGLEKEERSKANLEVAQLELQKVKTVQESEKAKEKATQDAFNKERDNFFARLEAEQRFLEEKQMFAEAEIKGLEIQFQRGLISQETFEKKRKEIVLKFSQETLKAREALAIGMVEADALENEIELQQKRSVLGEKEYQKQLVNIQREAELTKLILQRDSLQTQLDNAKQAGLLTIEQEQQIQNQILAIRKQIGEKTNEIDAETSAKQKELIDNVIGYSQQIENVAFQFADFQLEQKLQQFEERKSAIEASAQASIDKVSELEKRLETASAQDKVRIKQQIQNEKDKQKQLAEETKRIDKEIAESKRKNALIQAIVNTALAVTAFLAQGRVVESIVAGTTGAIQIATIANQKFEKGGQVGNNVNAKGGLAKGKPHSQGGIKFRVKGTPIVNEMEGGEYIVNKVATKKYLPILERINNSVAPIPTMNYSTRPYFQLGGEVKKEQQQQSQMSNEAMAVLINEVRALRGDVQAQRQIILSIPEVRDALIQLENFES